MKTSYEYWTVCETWMEPRGKKNRRKARCVCVCGTERNIFIDMLCAGNTAPSCGCSHTKKGPTKHGHAKKGQQTSEYRSWVSMNRRCYDQNQTRYSEWGGRGIGVCPEWRDDFQAFLRDMGCKPTPAHSIERRDNDADYSPANCFWASPKQQANNTRRNRHITLNGETLSLREWSEKTGLSRTTITQRIDSYGWTPERALTTPLLRQG